MDILLLLSIFYITFTTGSKTLERKDIEEILNITELGEMNQITEQHNQQVFNEALKLDTQIDQAGSKVAVAIKDCNRFQDKYIDKNGDSTPLEKMNDLINACKYNKFDEKVVDARQAAFKDYYVSRSLMMSRIEDIEVKRARFNYLKNHIEKLNRTSKFYMDQVNNSK